MNHVDVHVGRRINAARHTRQITRAALAAAIDVSVSRLLLYELGCDRVPARHLAAIATTLGIDAGWFFLGLYDDDSSDPSGSE